MNFNVIICSRKDQQPSTLPTLLNYYSRNAFNVVVKYDAKTIYDGYRDGYLELHSRGLLSDDDIIILCHDDILMLSDGDLVKSMLLNKLSMPNTGFVGVAGTTRLDKNCIWWDYNNRVKGLHRGFVFQGGDINTMKPNWFGDQGRVIVLDGCFLATTTRVLRKVLSNGSELSAKPDYLPNGWDYYDLHMCLTAYYEGYNNYTLPITLMHNSPGHPRNEWDECRTAFIRHHASNLPISTPLT